MVVLEMQTEEEAMSWKIHRNRRTGEIEKVDYLVDAGTYEIYEDGPNWIAHTLTLENAHCVSAARDLREALEGIIAEIDENECGASLSVRIGKARAAIKKARGE